MALVDDLGHAGVGFSSSSGEPITPHIDELASSGALLTRHYTFKYCSPSRSSFLSGRLPHHVNQQNRPPDVGGGGVAINMSTIGSVLRAAGYATVHAGKWHGGMSHPAQLPINRGFDTSLAMLSGAADHWTNERFGIVDLWRDDAPARGINGSKYSLYSYMHHALHAIESESAPSPYIRRGRSRYCPRHTHCPVSSLFPRRRIISGHDTARPLFLYLAFQNVHDPSEAPSRFEDLYPPSIYTPRRRGLSQVSAVDEALGNLTGALRLKRMWQHTLLVFSSDNGGPTDHEASSVCCLWWLLPLLRCCLYASTAFQAALTLAPNSLSQTPHTSDLVSGQFPPARRERFRL